MCNILHHEGREQIPESGRGYKILRVNETTGIKECVVRLHEFWKQDNGWVAWDRSYNKHLVIMTELDLGQPMGFCFFLDKDTAINACKNWAMQSISGYHIVTEIEYRKGLGSCLEHGFAGEGLRICLAYEWKDIDNIVFEIKSEKE
jgi:hypothetical protein